MTAEQSFVKVYICSWTGCWSVVQQLFYWPDYRNSQPLNLKLLNLVQKRAGDVMAMASIFYTVYRTALELQVDVCEIFCVSQIFVVLILLR